MTKAILGQKLGMTQIWDDKGRLVPATVIFAPANTVIEKSDDRVLVGIAREGKTSKPQQHLAKKLESKRGILLKEFKGVSPEGETLSVGQFQVGDKLSISGVTKGKGFAGTIKRHNFHRGPMTHGSNNIRQPGSIGAQRPQRVPKGQKMAGHMGAVNLTIRGNKVLAVNEKEQLLIVSGAVPGPAKGRLMIRSNS
jgi:large subunit ribosomal protein L3